MTIFRCPLCGGPLWEVPGGLRCPKGHRFDRAREGYVHLLPVGQKHSLAPGDDKAMVAARRAFLDRGWYAPLREALEQLAVAHTGGEPVVLDAGCGEGYYTQGMREALLSAGKTPHVAGIDISKFAVQKGAKRCPELDLAVASAYHLPVADEAVDLVLNVFSPLAIEEFRRVLKKGGYYMYVVPAAKHLWELKEVLYDAPYPNEEKETPYEGFAYREIVPVSYSVHLPTQADIQALFQMTPYAWKTPGAGKARLAALPSLDCQIDFRVHVFQRES